MRGDGPILLGLCLLTVATRVVTIQLWPHVAHFDETFQYLEQAQRMLTGRGMVPWEYVVGARSWLIPGALAPVLRVGIALSPDPAVWLACVDALMIAVSVCGTIAAFILGRRVGGRRHAAFAGLLAAIWCELVELSPHVLADTLSAIPLLAAFAFGYRVDDAGLRRTAATGLLLGLAFVLRIQLAPAIAVAMLGMSRRSLSHLLAMPVGFAVPVLLLGATDWATWGWPYRSMVTYVRLNHSGIADLFGTAPAWAYASWQIATWGIAAPVIGVTAVLGARRLPLVALVVATILATFSLVAHKEMRFVYPAQVLVVLLCGIGTPDLVAWLASRLAPGRAVAVPMLAAAGLWAALSVAVAEGAPMRVAWHRQDGWLAAFRRVDADPHACGLGVPADLWFFTGTVRLRQTIGLYVGDGKDAQPAAAAYDHLVTNEPAGRARGAYGSFVLVSCAGEAGDVCLYRRPGGCDPATGHPLEAEPDARTRAILRRSGDLAP